LPEAVAGDPDRIARFRREATLLASLNHPNIAAIYGFEHSGDGSPPASSERSAADRQRSRPAVPIVARVESRAPVQAQAGATAHAMALRLSARLRRAVPAPVRRAARRRGLAAWPPRRTIRFGSLRRTKPISSDFGFDRGTPVDRHYIEAFLRQRSSDIRGHCLELGGDFYLRSFGSGVTTGTSPTTISPVVPAG